MAQRKQMTATIDPLAALARVFDTTTGKVAKKERPALPGSFEAPAHGGQYLVSVHVPYDHDTQRFASANGLPLATGVYVKPGPMRDDGGRLKAVYINTIGDALKILDADCVKALRESASHLVTYWKTKATSRDRAMLAA